MTRRTGLRLTRRSGIALAVTALLAAAAIWTLLPGRSPLPITGAVAGFTPTEGRPPAAEISFSDAAGNSLSLADFRGRVVVLNLWATWCGPCVEEMPALDRLATMLGEEAFAVVAVSIDRDGAAAVAPFLAAHGIDALGTYVDPSGRVLADLVARGLPTTILVDAAGREVGRLEGAAAWDAPEARDLVASLRDDDA